MMRTIPQLKRTGEADRQTLPRPGGPSDEELDRVLAGDEDAFRSLYMRYRTIVYAVARAVLEGHGDADDVCQEAFVRVYRSLSTFRRGTRFSAWIATVARNAALSARQTNRREVPLCAELPVADLERESGIGDLVNLLSGDEQLVVTLRYVQDLSYEEMSGVLNRAPGTLRNLMSQALRRLRSCLQNKRGVQS